MSFSLIPQSPRARFAAVFLLTVLGLLPFVDKAVHIDDTLFIRVAEQIVRAPLDPFGFELNWYGTPMPVHEITKNPPLASYWLSVAGKLFGFREWALHLWFLMPALWAVAGVAMLARHFCKRPELAAAMTLVTPGFLVSATTLMCDVMMLAFFLWALYFWIAGIKTNRLGPLFAAAALIVLATLTKYFAISLFPLCAAYALLANFRPTSEPPRARRWQWILPLVVAAVPLVLYEWATAQAYGHGLLSEAVFYANERGAEAVKPIWIRLSNGLCFAGGSAALVLFFLPSITRRLEWIVLLAAGALAVVALGSPAPELAVGWVAQVAIWSVAGAGALCVLWNGKDPERVTLFLWGVGTFVFAALINWGINVRSMLPLIPAVAIAICFRLEQRELGLSRVLVPMVISAGLSLWLAQADFSLAEVNRTFIQAAVGRDPALVPPVRFQGHWGFQYYAENAGATALNFSGDRTQMTLLLPYNNTNQRDPGKHRILERVTASTTPGISTMNPKLGAGFYGLNWDAWGALPFGFGSTKQVMVILDVR